MKATIHGSPSFAYLEVVLEPGERVIAEASAMSSMSADLDMDAVFNGGFFTGLARKYFGGESLFVNVFRNESNGPRRVTLVQTTPGDMRAKELKGDALCFQPGAFIACTPGVILGIRWAGFASWLGGEGLFKLQVTGEGTVWYGGYGALVDRTVSGELIVDTGHLVAYDPGLTLKVALAGGIFSSFFGGEGLVTRVVGQGNIVVQTRSMSGLAGWLRSKLVW